jgi:hypothetical protein
MVDQWRARSQCINDQIKWPKAPAVIGNEIRPAIWRAIELGYFASSLEA